MIEKKLSDGQVVKAYPISSSQQMMFLMSLKYGSGYPVNNIGCGYYWKSEMDVKVMKESIYEAIMRCDTMRLRFTLEKKLQLHQYVTEYSDLIIEDWDYSLKTVEEAEKGEVVIFRIEGEGEEESYVSLDDEAEAEKVDAYLTAKMNKALDEGMDKEEASAIRRIKIRSLLTCESATCVYICVVPRFSCPKTF